MGDMWQIVPGTLAAEGVRGLYRGVLPTLLMIAPQSGVQFWMYHKLKEQVSAYSLWNAACNINH